MMQDDSKPRPRISNYITVEGEKRLREELDFLWRVERPKVTQQVSDAAAMGDRSENAEYIYGKKRLREIDRRVRHLRKRLEALTVVDKPPSDPSRIYFGAWITVEDEDGVVHDYRLVGPDEIAEVSGNTRFAGVTVETMNPAIAQELGLPFNAQGVVVRAVEAGSPAQRMGIETGDVIVSLNGQNMTDARTFQQVTNARPDGWQIVLQRGGRVFRSVVSG